MPRHNTNISAHIGSTAGHPFQFLFIIDLLGMKQLIQPCKPHNAILNRASFIRRLKPNMFDIFTYSYCRPTVMLLVDLMN